ncbi:MAG: helix-turn-helix transcriptional regulator [Hahellaceae bacterium]|nr:helix-turn-helix transcriptional regulator [Hahellaceae bacterium]
MREKSSYHKLEDVIGCKWSVSVLLAVGEGIARPGALERHIEGMSTKVLSERLRKLTEYGLLNKQSFPEVPPRTEYSLTSSGQKLIHILNQISTLDFEIGGNNIRDKH